MKEIIEVSRKGREFKLLAEENTLLIDGEKFSNPTLTGRKIEFNAVNGEIRIDHLSEEKQGEIRGWFADRDERITQSAQNENMVIVKNCRIGIFSRRGNTEYIMKDNFSWKWYGDYSPHTKFDGLDSSRISVGGYDRP